MNLARAMCWFGIHEFTRWRARLGNLTVGTRTRRCKRCGKVETGALRTTKRKHPADINEGGV